MTPGAKLQMLALRPFVRNRSEAEALVALVRHAGGERPKPLPAQEARLHRETRKEWMALAAIIIAAPRNSRCGKIAGGIMSAIQASWTLMQTLPK